MTTVQDPFLVFIHPQVLSSIQLIFQLAAIDVGIKDLENQVQMFGLDFANKAGVSKDLAKLKEFARLNEKAMKIVEAQRPENIWN